MLWWKKDKDLNFSNYETKLTKITEKITKCERSLVQTQLRSRNLKYHIFTKMPLLYLVYLSYLFFSSPSLMDISSQQLGTLLICPLLMLLALRVVTYLQKFQKNRQLQKLEHLQQSQRDILTEIKNLTNFSKLSEMLKKFGNLEDSKAVNEVESNQEKLTEDDQLYRQDAEKYFDKLEGRIMEKQKKIKVEQQKPASNRSGAFDYFLRLLVGDDEMSPNNRFALICGTCSWNNGLAPPNCADPASIKYHCSHCGAVNGPEPPVEMTEKKDSELKQSEK